MLRRGILLTACALSLAFSVSAKTIDFSKRKISAQNTELKLINGEIEISSKGGASWPGVIIQGPWDMSKYDTIEATVKNTGKTTVRANLRVDNPGSNGSKNCLNARRVIKPGEEVVISRKLNRKPAKGENVTILKGMNGVPPQVSTGGGIDVSNITKLMIFSFQVAGDTQLLVKKIELKGEYKAPKGKFTFPFVDEFGQYMHADWPGKIKSAQEMKDSVVKQREELAANPPPAEWNQYGGWANGPTLEATGNFRVAKHEGKWTLVDPEGKLFFSIGMDHVNIGGQHSSTLLLEREKWFKGLPSPNSPANRDLYFVRYVYTGDYNGRYAPCFSFITANLKRKFGHDWQKKGTENAITRLKSWGFNTAANWSDNAVYRSNKIPFTIGTAMAGSPGPLLGHSKFKVGAIHDPFAKSFSSEVESRLNRIKSMASSKWCIGVFVDNELYWSRPLAEMVLRSGHTSPAKEAFSGFLYNRYKQIGKLNEEWGTDYKNWTDFRRRKNVIPKTAKGKSDMSGFEQYIADTYYRKVKEAVTKILPGKLYLGSRFAQIKPQAFRAAAKYCDVVSFNIYQRELSGYKTPLDIDVPLMVGEFHFGAKDRGMFSGGLVTVKDQAERAHYYAKYVNSALKHPQFVGCHWFQYVDQPVTGRAFDGENYNIGFISNNDVPYKEMVDAARGVAKDMYQTRFGKK